MTRLSLVFIVLSAVAVSCVNAAPITYEFYSSFEGTGTGTNANAFPSTFAVKGLLSGSITTDGALGDLTIGDITSITWAASSAGGSTSEAGIVRYIVQGIYATPTTLSLLPGGDIELDSQTFQFGPFVSSDFSMAESGGGMVWSGSSSIAMGGGRSTTIGGSYPSLQIAVVGGGFIPEPSSIVLVVIGLPAAFMARRRLRARS